MPDDWPNRVILAVAIIGIIVLWLWIKGDESASRYRADLHRWELGREHHDGLHADVDVAGCDWCGRG